MNTTLLNRFLNEECTTHVRELLRTALHNVRIGTGPPRKRFEFNRFEVALDSDENIVVLEDVLDATNTGLQRLPSSEFAAALERST